MYEIDFYWQDGYATWHRETRYVFAENEYLAQETAEEQFDMPYGINSVEACAN